MEIKMYLADAIDYGRDIEPYQFIQIRSGVGSGKNYFIDRLIEGGFFKHTDGSLVPPQHILLITSRKAKVNEQLQEETVVYDPVIGAFDSNANDWLIYDDPKYDGYFESRRKTIKSPEGWGEHEIYLRSCVNTNAKAEWNIKQNYIHCDHTTHPWERFDMIVVDEVHSVLADASYQSAPFYVRRLIEETLHQSKTCKVIVMTGSPQIIKWHSLFSKAHIIDLMDVCNKVVPKRIEFISKEEANNKQIGLLNQDKKFVAFFNHIQDILELEDKYAAKVAMSFSDKKRLDEIAERKPKSYQRIIETQDYIAKHKELPDDVIAFLSTSRNKEGINIKNEDIHVMFVESHVDIDIIQMVGRIRNPIDVLYVVMDSVAHHDTDSRYEVTLSKRKDFLDAINAHFQEIAIWQGYTLLKKDSIRKTICSNKNMREYLEYIHGKFPYVRFDYFTDRFVFYSDREIGKKYYAEQAAGYVKARMSRNGLTELAANWYPGVPCEISDSIRLEVEEKAAVRKYLEENRWMNAEREIKSKERAEILQAIKNITGESGKTLGPLLKKYGFLLEYATRSKKTDAPMKIIEESSGEGEF